MRINHFFQNGLLGQTERILSRALDFRSANQQVISENLANVDTPGYQAKELRFDQELQQASEKIQLHLSTTNPGHFSNALELEKGEFPIETLIDDSTGSGQLNMDEEMAKMTKNNLLYEATTRLITKKLRALRSLLEEVRR